MFILNYLQKIWKISNQVQGINRLDIFSDSKKFCYLMYKEQGKLILVPISNKSEAEYPTINVHLNVIVDNLKWSLSILSCI